MRENFTVDHLEAGLTKAVNGLGQEVTVKEIVSSIARAQGCVMYYDKPNNGSQTWITANGTMLKGTTTVLDIYLIK